MPSIKWNKKVWGSSHLWPKDGDEWDDQAAFCQKPYKEWKNSIAENFIYNNINKKSAVLEIAPGHGRWTKFILEKADNLALVDLSPECIGYCRKKFAGLENKKISYFTNNGKDLSFIKNKSIDFIWSYDSFVHFEKGVIDSYLEEFSRILKNGGVAIIHHAGRNDSFLKFRFLNIFGNTGKKIYNYLTVGKFDKRSADRSDISREKIKRLAAKHNLAVLSQVDCWGKNNEYNNKLFNDYISKIAKE